MQWFMGESKCMQHRFTSSSSDELPRIQSIQDQLALQTNQTKEHVADGFSLDIGSCIHDINCSTEFQDPTEVVQKEIRFMGKLE